MQGNNKSLGCTKTITSFLGIFRAGGEGEEEVVVVVVGGISLACVLVGGLVQSAAVGWGLHRCTIAFSKAGNEQRQI